MGNSDEEREAELDRRTLEMIEAPFRAQADDELAEIDALWQGQLD